MPSILTVALAFLLTGNSFVPRVARLRSISASRNSQASKFAATAAAGISTKSRSPVFEYLKFDGSPEFDVLQRTKDYVDSVSKGMSKASQPDPVWYDEDYVLRGPVIGPIGRDDVSNAQSGLGLREAFPDIRQDSFGFTIDPENPYRCFYFARWRATHTQDLDAYGTIYPATGIEVETPVTVFSVVWTPQGRIIYEQVGAVVDRFEGNTEGKAAVFGLLHVAGLKLPAVPGIIFATIQRLGHALAGKVAGVGGRSWSREGDIPSWWVSKSRGADDTDVW